MFHVCWKPKIVINILVSEPEGSRSFTLPVTIILHPIQICNIHLNIILSLHPSPLCVASFQPKSYMHSSSHEGCLCRPSQPTRLHLLAILGHLCKLTLFLMWLKLCSHCIFHKYKYTSTSKLQKMQVPVSDISMWYLQNNRTRGSLDCLHHGIGCRCWLSNEGCRLACRGRCHWLACAWRVCWQSRHRWRRAEEQSHLRKWC